LRKIKFAILAFLILILHITGGSAQDDLDLDYSITMPSIEVIQGSLAVPAPLDLLTQGILKIFADADSDGNITQEEADALIDGMSEETKANMSLRLEDLEPLIQTSVGIDYRESRTLEVLDMKLAGLVGPVNSSTPLAFIISFTAEFNVEDRIGHTISFGIDESYAGDVDFEFTAPEGWEVDRVSGLTGESIEGRNVYGTPISQVDISISEEISTDFVYICIGISIVVVVAIIIVIFLVLRKSKSKKITTSQYPQQATAAPTQPPTQATPPAQPQYQTPEPAQQPSQATPSAQPQYQTPAPAQLQPQAAPSAQPPPQAAPPAQLQPQAAPSAQPPPQAAPPAQPPPQATPTAQPPPQAAPPVQPSSQVQPPPPPPPAPNICKQCGSNMSWIGQYQRYYCNYCRQYR
jgi:hypothetical protein